MLSITPQALVVMRRVTAHPRMKPTAGLRIARRDEQSEPFQVGAVQEPHAGDRVVRRDGARLYLGRAAVSKVEGRELHAVTEPNGRVQFILKAAA